jgi:hypothetical protein
MISRCDLVIVITILSEGVNQWTGVEKKIQGEGLRKGN